MHNPELALKSVIAIVTLEPLNPRASPEVIDLCQKIVCEVVRIDRIRPSELKTETARIDQLVAIATKAHETISFSLLDDE